MPNWSHATDLGGLGVELAIGGTHRLRSARAGRIIYDAHGPNPRRAGHWKTHCSGMETGMLRAACGTNPLEKLVGVRGFEPPAPASRKQCSTRLSYTPSRSREL